MNVQLPTKPPQTLRLIIVSVVIGVIGGILLMGIPGGLVLELVDFIKDYFAMSPIDLPGDAVWPTAIMISLLWPLPITPLAFLHHKLFPQKGALSRWIFCLIGSFILTITMAFMLL